jgi:hypothetical protein
MNDDGGGIPAVPMAKQVFKKGELYVHILYATSYLFVIRQYDMS